MSKLTGFAVMAFVGVTLPASAGTVSGKVELPPAPAREPSAPQGFVKRVPNQLATVQPAPVAPYVVVVLENDTKPENAPDVTWEIVGESFNKPIVAVPVGANLVIHNVTNNPRTLTCPDDKSFDGLINPTMQRPVKVTAAKAVTVSAVGAPHLKGKVLGVSSTHIASVDANGKFDIEVPEGTYKVRVYYRDAWSDKEESVKVPAKGSVPVTISLAAPPAKKQ